MGHWFELPDPWVMTVLAVPSPRYDPDQNYARWFAGENAFCEWCNMRTPLLYAVTFPDLGASYAVCRACAERMLRD